MIKYLRKFISKNAIRAILQKFRIPTFIWIIVPTIIIVSLPLVLKFPIFFTAFSWFLDSLPNADYKIAYIGLIGSIIGTYLAITGAIWTQKREQSEKTIEEIKKAAIIVYYDLKLGCLELMSICNYGRTTLDGDIYFTSDWIERVASFPTNMLDIQKIYSIYGDLNNVKLRLNTLKNKDKGIVDFVQEDVIYKVLIKDFHLNEEYNNAFINDKSYDEQKLIDSCVVKDIKVILEKLKIIAEIND